METTVRTDLASTPQRSWHLGLGIALLFTVLALTLYSEHQDWPAAFHHDEPSKVLQISDQLRNLYHPLFLLEATEWARKISGVQRDDKTGIVAIGRGVSAVCMALAVGIAALAAYWRHSWIAAFTVGTMMLLCFRFYEVAHYFKEDTPHLLGLSLVMLTGFLHARSPSRRTVFAMGLAVGVAMSSKYAGAGFFSIALALIALYPAGRLRTSIGILIGAALGITLLIHLRFLIMLDPLGKLTRSLSQEVTWMIQGHKGVGMEVPNWDYFVRLFYDVGMHGIALILLWVPFVRRLHKADAVLIVFSMTYFAVLTMSPKYSERYLLPISLIVLFYIGLQLANLIQSVQALGNRRMISVSVAAILMTMVLVPSVPWLQDYRQAFATDSRQSMITVLHEHLSTDAHIAADAAVRLKEAEAQATGGYAALRYEEAEFAPQLGTLDELRDRGVTHLIICYDTYHRFIAKGATASGDQAKTWQLARDFYLALQVTEPLWKSEPRNPKPLHPGLEVYPMPPKL